METSDIKKSKRIFWIAITLNLLLVIGFLVYFYQQSHGSNTYIDKMREWWDRVNVKPSHQVAQVDKDVKTPTQPPSPQSVVVQPQAVNVNNPPLEQTLVSGKADSVTPLVVNKQQAQVKTELPAQQKQAVQQTATKDSTNKSVSKNQEQVTKTDNTNKQTVTQAKTASKTDEQGAKKADVSKTTDNNISDTAKQLISIEIGDCVNFAGIADSDNVKFLKYLEKYKTPKSHYLSYYSDIYEVVWQLGKDKEKAEALFEVQKTGGTLKDEKYQLRMRSSDWSWEVPIAQVLGNEALAKEMVEKLSSSAKNAGGKWEYSSIGRIYTYHFFNYGLIDKKLAKDLEDNFGDKKVMCQREIAK